MAKSAIQYEQFHEAQRDAKYRKNFALQMKDELQQAIDKFPTDTDIKVTIRVEHVDATD